VRQIIVKFHKTDDKKKIPKVVRIELDNNMKDHAMHTCWATIPKYVCTSGLPGTNCYNYKLLETSSENYNLRRLLLGSISIVF
jgi:hypothetical protein